MPSNTLTAANQNAPSLNGLYREIDAVFPDLFTPAEQALRMAIAKAHYELLFPQSRAGARQGLGAKHGSGQNPAPATFTEMVVKRAEGRRGWSKSSIKQVVLHGERIRRDVLEAIIEDKDGDFNKGTFLRELSGIDQKHQMEHYLREKSGTPPTPTPPASSHSSTDWWRGQSGVVDKTDHFRIPGVVDLYLGKSEEVLSKLKRRVDLVASDVPYGIDYKDGAIPNDKDAEDTSNWAVPLYLDMLKDDAFAFICTRWDVGPIWMRQHAQCGASVCGRVVWDKKMPNGRPSPFVSRTEDILVARKGHPKLREWINVPVADFGDESLHLDLGFEDKEVGRVVKADIDLWPIPVPRGGGAGSEHETRKPVAMGVRMILNGSDAGDVVLDPFMGTGPFAVAAILTGREFIGVEMQARHFAEAVRRVKAALRHVAANRAEPLPVAA